MILQLLSASLLAAAPAPAPTPRDPGMTGDVQDVIFCGKVRPVLIRMHVLADGKPFFNGWDELIAKFFEYADRNKDGKVDRNELANVPTAQMLQTMMTQYPAIAQPGGRLALEDVDPDGSGGVTLDELKAYYNRSRISPIRLVDTTGTYGTQTSSAMTRAILDRLDTNKDGKLSKEELAGAEKLVFQLDGNEDELLDIAELAGPAMANQLGGVRVIKGGEKMMMPRPAVPGGVSVSDSVFVLVPREKGAGQLSERLQLSQQIIKHYDKDQSGKLTRDEIGLDEETFNALDRNSDRLLDATELLRYAVASPDVEITVQLRRNSAGQSGPTIALTPGQKRSLSDSVRQASGNTLALSLPNLQVELRQADGINGNVQNIQYAMQLYRQVDPQNKGVVELKTLQQQNFQYYRAMFESADKDGDGKVTREEFLERWDLNAQAMFCTAVIGVSESGEGIFGLLDANRDGRLSVRELRTAAARLEKYDLNKDGAFAADEVPISYRMIVNPGANPTVNPRQFNPQFGGYNPTPTPGPTAGPLWFRKMDKNSDGDVSSREFLGTPEQFSKLDLDGDGYIGLEEATKAESLYRKTAAKKE